MWSDGLSPALLQADKMAARPTLLLVALVALMTVINVQGGFSDIH